jgi:hypothetical protein
MVRYEVSSNRINYHSGNEPVSSSGGTGFKFRPGNCYLELDLFYSFAQELGYYLQINNDVVLPHSGQPVIKFSFSYLVYSNPKR